MPYQINIFNIKVNGMTNNANVDVGPTVHNSHTSNMKFVGTNFSLGDISPSASQINSGMIDPDISDQGQIANPSAPIANQL
ncbi:spore germination protein [Neobacillus sp. D3-1R]|uniref:spore germination protein n=1 Tax=Neobacillus sp. D3-1R TaxID=3445778 RepID=UPI003FA02F8A